MFQQVILVGNVGQDPETRFTGSGKSVSNFSVATSKSFQDSHGEWQENTTWHKVVAWEKVSESVSKNIKKGSKVFVLGEISIRQYEDKDKQKRTSYEIVAKVVRNLTPKPKDAPAQRGEAPSAEVTDEDIPF